MSKRALLSSAFAAALVIGLASTPSHAQSKNAQGSFGGLIAALNNINVQLENLDVDIIGDIEVGDVEVTVVDASELLKGARIRALNNALNRNNVEILNLRNVLNDNDVLNDALNNLNIDIDDVIAIDVLSGELVVFTL